MKLLFDFFPILLFFIAFKIAGIYAATATFMVASLLQMSIYWYRFRHFEKIHLITFFTGILLGGATLLLQNELYIKWKPTIIYWILAFICLATHIFGKKPLIQRLLETNIDLPIRAWSCLNLVWTIFFAILGFVNLYVAYHYSTNTWVNFKLFGLFSLTLGFVIIQGIYIAKFVKNKEPIK